MKHVPPKPAACLLAIVYKKRLTSTEAEPDIAFLPNLNLSKDIEADLGAGGGGVTVREVEEQSTVFCLGIRSLVNFSPIDASRNQGRDIFLLLPNPVSVIF